MDDLLCTFATRTAPAGAVTVGPHYATLLAATPSPKQAGRKPVPRKRFQERGRVFQRGKRKPHWWGSYYDVGMLMPDGTVKRPRRTVKLGPISSMSKRAAQALLRKNHLDRVNVFAAPPTKAGMKLKDFIPEWLENIACVMPDSTRAAANSHIKTHLIPRLGDTCLTDINNRTVQEFVTAIHKGGTSGKTIKNILSTFSGILNKARLFGYTCGQFSMAELTLPEHHQTREVSCYSIEYQGKIIAHSKEPYATIFSVASQAPRPSEVIGLKVEDLDFENKLIHIRRSLDSRTRREKSTKTHDSRAAIPMPVQLEKRLRSFLANHWRESSERFLFINEAGRPFTLGNLTRYLNRVQKRLGYKPAGMYGFRHGHASELVRIAPLSVAQKQLRHSSVATTAKHYVHVMRNDHATAVSLIATKLERAIEAAQSEPSA